MGFIRLSLVLIFLAFSLPTYGAQSVAPPTMTPIGVFIHEPTVVTVVSSIASDPNRIDTSVNLLSTEPNGRPVNLGRMYDDGTHGDEAAADGRFTTQILVSRLVATRLALQVSVAYRGQLLRVLSPASIFPVIDRQRDDVELDQLLGTQSTAAAMFADRRISIGDVAAIQEVLGFLQGRQGVQSALLSDDRSTITVITPGGLAGLIPVTPPESLGFLGKSLPELQTPLPTGFPPSLAATAAIEPMPVFTTPGNGNAIILAPFHSDPSTCRERSGELICPLDLLEDKIIFELRKATYTPVVRRGPQVTLDLLRGLPSYGVIAFLTHGGVGQYPCGPLMPPCAQGQTRGSQFSGLATGEPVAANLSDERRLQWSTGQILPFAGVWWVTSRFFEVNLAVSRATYPKSLVFVVACSSTVTPAMPESFLRRGAGAYLGFKTPIDAVDAFEIAGTFFEALVDTAAIEGTRTVETAFVRSNLPFGIPLGNDAQGNPQQGPQLPGTYEFFPGAGINLRQEDAGANLGLAPMLTVTTEGPGIVTILPEGTVCGEADSPCFAFVPQDTSATLDARPVNGSYFDGWGGACAASGTSLFIALGMTKDETCTATFATTLSFDMDRFNGLALPVTLVNPFETIVGGYVDFFVQQSRAQIVYFCRRGNGPVGACSGSPVPYIIGLPLANPVFLGPSIVAPAGSLPITALGGRTQQFFLHPDGRTLGAIEVADSQGYLLFWGRTPPFTPLFGPTFFHRCGTLETPLCAAR